MITKAPSNPNLQKELDALNEEVTAALTKRKAWMDAHMEDFSGLRVRDKVYDGRTGQFLGTVTKLYRYQETRNPHLDTHMSVEIEYETLGGVLDNSSRHAGCGPWFCTAEVAAKLMEQRADYTGWKAAGSNWYELFK